MNDCQSRLDQTGKVDSLSFKLKSDSCRLRRPTQTISGRQSVHATFKYWLSSSRTWPKQVWKSVTGAVPSTTPNGKALKGNRVEMSSARTVQWKRDNIQFMCHEPQLTESLHTGRYRIYVLPVYIFCLLHYKECLWMHNVVSDGDPAKIHGFLSAN